MIASPASIRRIGWFGLIALCCAMMFGLSLKVNALRSEVRATENRILALKRETMYLETEYETRSSQQQLASWNAVDFGYVAPTAGQYFENVRQLAALGKARAPDAPAPIRVAAAQTGDAPARLIPAMVSPLTGKPFGDEDEVEADPAPVDHDRAAANLAHRLGKLDRDDAAKGAKTAVSDKAPASTEGKL